MQLCTLAHIVQLVLCVVLIWYVVVGGACSCERVHGGACSCERVHDPLVVESMA